MQATGAGAAQAQRRRSAGAAQAQPHPTRADGRRPTADGQRSTAKPRAEERASLWPRRAATQCAVRSRWRLPHAGGRPPPAPACSASASHAPPPPATLRRVIANKTVGGRQPSTADSHRRPLCCLPHAAHAALDTRSRPLPCPLPDAWRLLAADAACPALAPRLLRLLRLLRLHSPSSLLSRLPPSPPSVASLSRLPPSTSSVAFLTLLSSPWPACRVCRGVDRCP